MYFHQIEDEFIYDSFSFHPVDTDTCYTQVCLIKREYRLYLSTYLTF